MTLAVAEMAHRLALGGRTNGVDAVCCVTGQATSDHVSFAEVFSDNFGDWDLLAVPSSKRVDRRVAEVLANGHLRWSSWIWDSSEGLRIASRWQIKEIVVSGRQFELGAIYAAEDMRRHGGLLTHTFQGPAVVQLGRRGPARGPLAAQLLRQQQSMVDRGWNTTSVKTLSASHPELAKLDIADWDAYCRSVRPWANCLEWALAGWMLSAKPEDKSEPEPSDG